MAKCKKCEKQETHSYLYECEYCNEYFCLDCVVQRSESKHGITEDGEEYLYDDVYYICEKCVLEKNKRG